MTDQDAQVMWHDLECGRYVEDLHLWRSLADEWGGPVLDVGAGTGRVTLELARSGHPVTALEHDERLLAELARRSGGLEVTTVLGDAREFDLGERFPLCIVPMQTIQLLEGPSGRERFLHCARRHLRADGMLAVAISETLDSYEVAAGDLGPAPDVGQLDGAIYCSYPTAVRAEADVFVIERRREIRSADRAPSVEQDTVRLDRLSAEQLEREASLARLTPAGRATVRATREYTGSEVVLLRA